jgi:hypothetical protein
MLKRAARRADAVARLLPETDPGKATARACIARLGNECGCAMGGAFLIAASLLVAVYAVVFGELGVRLVVLGVVFVFVASMLGKLTGILIAVARLAVIGRRLGGRVASVVDATHQPAARGA